MKLLSRKEELLLNCIQKLKEEAYTFMIREKLKEITGKTWAFSAIFISLDAEKNIIKRLSASPKISIIKACKNKSSPWGWYTGRITLAF